MNATVAELTEDQLFELYAAIDWAMDNPMEPTGDGHTCTERERVIHSIIALIEGLREEGVL